MKKYILIFYCVLQCTLGWAQDNYLANAAKNKAQNGPISARTPENEAKRLLVYPNPTTGIVHLTLAGFKGKKTELRIMNVIGNVVYREMLSEPDERFTKTVDLTRYPVGLYYVKLQAEDFSEIRKIIIN